MQMILKTYYLRLASIHNRSHIPVSILQCMDYGPSGVNDTLQFTLYCTLYTVKYSEHMKCNKQYCTLYSVRVLVCAICLETDMETFWSSNLQYLKRNLQILYMKIYVRIMYDTFN